MDCDDFGELVEMAKWVGWMEIFLVICLTGAIGYRERFVCVFSPNF